MREDSGWLSVFISSRMPPLLHIQQWKYPLLRFTKQRWLPHLGQVTCTSSLPLVMSWMASVVVFCSIFRVTGCSSGLPELLKPFVALSSAEAFWVLPLCCSSYLG